MPTISKDVWTTREGQEIEIKMMSSSHLLATIHFIERNRFMNAAEVYSQQKMDGMDWKDAIEYYMQWPAQYESLVAEAQRRNLIYRAVNGTVKVKNNA